MDLAHRLTVLEKMYAVYDDIISTDGMSALACTKGCASCCTRNLTMTTLEGLYLVDRCGEAQRGELFDRIHAQAAKERFQPSITINRMAELCARDADIPDEGGNEDLGPCPVLDADICPAYPLRPFGCRSMVSKKDCRKTGYADMDDFVLALNDVFMQYLEHIDSPGFSGNFTDVMLYLASQENRALYQKGQAGKPPKGLLANLPVHVLMVPPEHRQRLQPILKRLNSIRV
jgi:Fe-S-cluster containining protein